MIDSQKNMYASIPFRGDTRPEKKEGKATFKSATSAARAAIEARDACRAEKKQILRECDDFRAFVVAAERRIFRFAWTFAALIGLAIMADIILYIL